MNNILAKALQATSLKVLLTVSTGAIAALLVTKLGLNSYSDWRSFQQAGTAAERLVGLAELGRGLANHINERHWVGTYLVREQVVGRSEREEIERWGRPAAEGFARGLPQASTVPFRGHEEAMRAAQTAASDMAALRVRAEAALARPRAERDADLARSYADGSARLIDTGAFVWSRAMRAASAHDQAIAGSTTIANLAWDMRFNAGFIRSTLAYAIGSGRPISPEGLARIEDMKGAVRVLWSQLELRGADANLDPKVSEAIRAVDRSYRGQGGFEARARALVQASAAGQPYGTDAAEWTRWTNGLFDHIIDLMSVASNEARDRATERAAQAQRDMVMSLAFLIAGVVIGLFTVWVVFTRLIGPLGILTQAVGRLRSGDLASEIAAPRNRDELGNLTEALIDFRQGLIEAERLRAAASDEMGARVARAEALEALVLRFDQAASASVAASADSMQRMRETAERVTGVASETLQRAETVEGAADATSRNVTTVAGATEELAASVEEIGRLVTDANGIIGRAVQEADASTVLVKSLAESAKSIEQVVELISSIAAQTNLLALNATIEAARAGEAGRGFAVVASEVKALATQTGKATEEIAQQIAKVQTGTGQAVSAIGKITETVRQMSSVATSIAGAIEEQSATTQDINRNLNEAAQGTDVVSGNIRDVRSAASTTDKSARDVLAALGDLETRNTELKREIATFINDIKAA